IGASRVACAFLVYMLPPLPRCSGWAYSRLISPIRVSLPRKGHRVGLHIVLFEACSAVTRVAACTLARSPYFVTRYPKASDISSPPCLLRLLPAGAVAGWDLHPLESAAFSRRTPITEMMPHTVQPYNRRFILHRLCRRIARARPWQNSSTPAARGSALIRPRLLRPCWPSFVKAPLQ